ncbi:MAG TPA: TIGR01459 family HAD-type hydrolase [Caulobacteraceae bacterium]|jgi:HAD superfamily hydrolase (TIGR01459 family)
MTDVISGLGELALRFDALLCDVWGVIHNGRESFPKACVALERWRTQVGPVILISNAPRPAEAVARQLDGLGVPRSSWSAIVTSGDVSRSLLAALAPGPAFRIGPAKDDPLYAGLGLAFASVEDSAFIACSGPNDEDVETPEDYRAVLSVAAGRGLTMICANPDLVVQRGDALIYCAGALAKLYEALGGEVIWAGKPYAPIYDLAYEKAGRPDRSRVLAIGDGLLTDLAGAREQELDALFVADGVHAADALTPRGEIDAARLTALLAPSPPAFALRALAW